MAGIFKVCDALVVIHKGKRPYVLAVEMKSKNEGEAEKQIQNAKLLMDWIFGLLRLYGHWHDGFSFCGVISLMPRNQERKGATGRAADLPKPESSRRWGYPIFRLRNHPRLDLVKIVDLLDAAR